MNLVVDANLVVALFVPLPYSDAASRRMTSWQRTHTELFASLLLEYEVSTVLRKAIVAGLMTTQQARDALGEISALGIQCLPPTLELHNRALYWADRLGRSKAYDACYMALAEQMRCELWTADRRLTNNARQSNVTWVHWIGYDDCLVSLR